jgi:putative nucleotidyltransferase with HDIG domain
MRPAKVQELAAGQVIASDVRNALGEVVMPAGTVFGPRLHTLFKAWNIAEVNVAEDEPTSSSSPPSLPLPSLLRSPRIQRLFGNNDFAHPVIAELASVVERLAVGSSSANDHLVSIPAATGGASRGQRAFIPVTAETIVAKVGVLASLPNVYFRVDRAINHPASSSADIGAVLRQDMALTARLLRIGNSAFYGFSRRVEDIDEAVRIIGTRQLHDLVLATVVLSQFKGMDARLVTMQSFWQHSLACGIAARAIAKRRRENNIERFFVAGLLHDIGSLVLYQQFPERAQAALERHLQTDVGLEDAERSTVGCDHGAVGAALMTAWTLPQFFREAALNHHSSGHRSHTPGTAVIHLADLISLSLDLGTNGEVRLPHLSAPAWELVGLPLSTIGGVADEVFALLEEAQRMFLDDAGPDRPSSQA